jgi:hypothetical protein
MWSRLRSLAGAFLARDRFEREMRDEVRFHIEARAEDLAREGLPPAEALRRARMEFGTVDAIKDDCRQSRGLRWLDELSNDLRYALRLMRKTPGFTTAAVLSLALGIGANTAIFSLMDAVLLRTLPVASPQDLVFFAHGTGERPGTSSNYPLFERFRAIDGLFTGVTAFSPTAFKLSSNDGIENIAGLWVNGTFHGVLGVPMAIGRGFSSESDQPTDAPTVVISDAFWLRRFGRDPSVLDRSITLDGRPVAIVGVTAPAFTGLIPGTNPDVTMPIAVRAITRPDYLTMHDTWTDLTIVGRLKPGVSAAAALAPVDAVFRQYMSEPENAWIAKINPGAFANAVFVPASRGSGVLRRQYETALKVLMGMVAIVLLIASVNVANLLLVRSAARAKEVAIRMCVGGGRARLIRQFLTESLLLALAGDHEPVQRRRDAAPDRRLAEAARAGVHRGNLARHRHRVRIGAGVRVDERRSDTGAQGRRRRAPRPPLVVLARAGRRADRLEHRRAGRRNAARAHALQPEVDRCRLHAWQPAARDARRQRHADSRAGEGAGVPRGPRSREGASGRRARVDLPIDADSHVRQRPRAGDAARRIGADRRQRRLHQSDLAGILRHDGHSPVTRARVHRARR